MNFRGEYEFLSNFSSSPIAYDGCLFPTVEHAFQYAKVEGPVWKKMIKEAETPGRAKKIGRRGKMIADWDSKKFGVMLTLLNLKFADDELKEQLLETELQNLVETNTWHDRTWGVCCCDKCGGKGENMLGKLLMQVRDRLRRERSGAVE